MITESFLSSCYELVFAQKEREPDESVYRDLLYYLRFAEKKFLGGEGVGIVIKKKFDLIKAICRMKLKHVSDIEIITTIGLSENYRQFKDFIFDKTTNKMSEREQSAREKTIHKLVAFCNLNRTYREFADYQESVLEGCFDTLDEVIEDWTGMVKSAAADVTDYELKTRSELVSSLNTRSDSIDAVLQEIAKKYSKTNVVPSGIQELDREYLNGGFQPSRLYMFSGTSGIGKSLFLINSVLKASMTNPSYCFFPPEVCLGEQEPERTFLYITMENYIYETWIRLFCSLFRKTKEEMLAEVYQSRSGSNHIKQDFDNLMKPYNSSIQIEYFPANTVSPASIASLITKLNSEPEKRTVKAVYVDYLDLLVPDERREFYRLDLGEITSKLKAISANFEIPIITATQLNREAYRQGKKGDLGSETISESMQKLFIADFSAMMFREDPPSKDGPKEPDDMPKKVNLKIGKNRDGKTGKTHIYFDYPRSRLISRDEFAEEYDKLLAI